MSPSIEASNGGLASKQDIQKVLMAYKSLLAFWSLFYGGANGDLCGEQAVAYKLIRVYRPPFIFRGLLWAVLMEVPAAVKGLV